MQQERLRYRLGFRIKSEMGRGGECDEFGDGTGVVGGSVVAAAADPVWGGVCIGAGVVSSGDMRLGFAVLRGRLRAVGSFSHMLA